MRLNRAELRKVIYDFNSISNRLMKADFQDYKGILSKFLNFLSESSIISDYLNDCGSPTIPSIEAEVNEVAASYGRVIFSTGDMPTEENANIFAILRYLAESNIVIHGAVMGYASGTKKYNDFIKGFNERFVLILIRNIEGYLTKLGIDMGLDESISYNITVTNGQVNLASDNAVIHATLNNGANAAQLKSLIDKVMSESQTELSEDEIVTVTESVAVIEQEIVQEKPKKSVLRGIVATLQNIKGTVEFVAAVSALAQFVQQNIH